jgi:pSer/pThr/pTyr-binding forkhead associated (FHA) protein
MRLYSDETTIGRARDNDIVVPDEYVSRHEAVIRCMSGAYLLVLCQVRNPVLLNHDRVEGMKQLLHGDEILMGRTEFHFIIDHR